jgi:uncharacterized membrane protein
MNCPNLGERAKGKIMSGMQSANIDISDSSSANGWTVVESYSTYEDAQRAVDRLSDASFPVENVEIVGRDLRLVERVTGRVTLGRATAAGAASGAWFGLFIGLLVGLFTTGPEWLGLVLGGLLIGAFWGAAFGFFAHWATRGKRDFASVRSLAADRYDLTVTDAQAERARQLLGNAAASPS